MARDQHSRPPHHHTTMSANIPSSAIPPTAAPTGAISTPELPTFTATPSFAVNEESPRPTRRGRKNFTLLEVEKLLDIVGDILPLGCNMWALVAARYGEWAAVYRLPERDQDSLKNKFDKLAATKKSTGDPTCPAPVRAAKNIARNILASAHAVSAGDEDALSPPSPPPPPPTTDLYGAASLPYNTSGELAPGPSSDPPPPLPLHAAQGADATITTPPPGVGSPTGLRTRARGVATRGVAKKKKADPLVVSVEKMAASMAAITAAIVTPSPTNLEEMVRDQVSKAMETNTAKLDEIKKCIEALAKK